MDGFIILIVIVAIVAAVIYSSKQRTAAKTSWKTAARSLGLTCNDPGTFSNPRIRGSLNGYRVNVDVVTRGAGKHQRTLTRYRIHYPSLRLGMRLSKEVPVFTAVTKAFGSQDIEIGHGEFDDDVLVKGRSARKIRAFLSGRRRSIVHRFLTSHQDAEITDVHASFETAGIETNAVTVQRSLSGLARLAMELAIDPEEAPATEASPVAPSPIAPAPPPPIATDDAPRVIAATTPTPEMAEALSAIAALPIVLETREDKQERRERERRERIARDLANAVGAVAENTADAGTDKSNDDGPAAVAPIALPESPAAEMEPHVEPASVPEPTVDLAPQSHIDTPAPAPPADRSIQTSICERLFGGDLRIPDVKALFTEQFDGTGIEWTGRLKSVRAYYSDLVFGSEPGTRAEVVVAKVSAGMFGEREVSAVVQLPKGMEDELRKRLGEEVTFKGSLLSLDPFMREIYVAGGDLDT